MRIEPEYLTTYECLQKIREHGTTAEEMLKGLMRPNTSEILEVVQAAGRINCTDIELNCDEMRQPDVSFGLRYLRLAGVVTRERHGKFQYYSAVPEQIGKINRIAAKLAEMYNPEVI